MGAICSRSPLEREEEEKESRRHIEPGTSAAAAEASIDDTYLKMSPSRHHGGHRADNDDVAAARGIIKALNANIAVQNGDATDELLQSLTNSSSTSGFDSVDSVDDYMTRRGQFRAREKALDFDHRCRTQASMQERLADSIIQRLRAHDDDGVYAAAPERIGYGGQLHPRFAGDHFLSNLDLINQTALFDVARHMPKGAHLHIHFNACLAPSVLLNIAKEMDRMFITSNVPLLADDNFVNYDRCEIQFSLLSPEKENAGDLFSKVYKPRQTMKFSDFLAQFPEHYSRSPVDDWLLNKLMFGEEETHNHLQTASGAWEKFNGRTRMMKGLFNYETAYRKYTRLCLEDFVDDNIQYAEIRPNFMTSNQLFHDDGTRPIDNWGIMQIIIQEVEAFQADMVRQGKTFGGLKVIYCTPRSFKPQDIQVALDECIEFKKRWPQWIAGFDLVGEESKGRSIKDFIPELLRFREKCSVAQLDIPFLFHCGETLDMGTETDGNLIDALLLNSRRIGHGFALVKHPYVMQHMKEQNICLELCPISNEILGLTPRVGGHAMYSLLANNVHCTVSSDNGTLFRSSLSHDFYQTMVGKADMSLYGWKQLILWSLEHACLDDTEYKKIHNHWEQQWDLFLQWLINNYGIEADTR